MDTDSHCVDCITWLELIYSGMVMKRLSIGARVIYVRPYEWDWITLNIWKLEKRKHACSYEPLFQFDVSPLHPPFLYLCYATLPSFLLADVLLFPRMCSPYLFQAESNFSLRAHGPVLLAASQHAAPAGVINKMITGHNV